MMTEATRRGEARRGTTRQRAERTSKRTDIGTTGDKGMMEETKGARHNLSGVSEKEYEQRQTKPKMGLGEYFFQVRRWRWLWHSLVSRKIFSTN